MDSHAEKEVVIPEGIEVEIADGIVKVRGSSGELSRSFDSHVVNLEKSDHNVKVVYEARGRRAKKYANTIASHINNMATGLTKGYVYKLQAVHSHFPMNITMKGDVIEINNFMGAKNPRRAKIVSGAKVEVKDKDITVSGVDKEAVGQTAANIENAARSRGRDIRIFQDGIYMISRGFAEDAGGQVQKAPQEKQGDTQEQKGGASK